MCWAGPGLGTQSGVRHAAPSVSPLSRRGDGRCAGDLALGWTPEGTEAKRPQEGCTKDSVPTEPPRGASYKDGDLRKDKGSAVQARQEGHLRQREQPVQRGGVEKQGFGVDTGGEGQVGTEAEGQAAESFRRAAAFCTVSSPCDSAPSRLFHG